MIKIKLFKYKYLDISCRNAFCIVLFWRPIMVTCYRNIDQMFCCLLCCYFVPNIVDWKYWESTARGTCSLSPASTSCFHLLLSTPASNSCFQLLLHLLLLLLLEMPLTSRDPLRNSTLPLTILTVCIWYSMPF